MLHFPTSYMAVTKSLLVIGGSESSGVALSMFLTELQVRIEVLDLGSRLDSFRKATLFLERTDLRLKMTTQYRR